MVITASTKGQIVIPADIRKKLGIAEGTKLDVTESGGTILLRPVSTDPVDDGFGMFAGGPSLVDLLLDERRREMERGDSRF